MGEDKESTITAVKDSGLGLMKSVKAAAGKAALSRPWFRALERFDRRACCRRLSVFKTVTCFSPDHKNLAFEYQEVSPSVVFLPYKCVLVFLMQLVLVAVSSRRSNKH